MNFVIDAQLPPGLISWLSAKGHTAKHVNELSLTNADDTSIWDHAVETVAIVITKGEDFAERTSRTVSGPVIVWLRIGNATNKALMIWLEPRWLTITSLIEEGHRLIEVR